MLCNAGIIPTRGGGGIITGAHTPTGVNRLTWRRGQRRGTAAPALVPAILRLCCGDFLGLNREAAEPVRTKGGSTRDVCRVATPCYQDASDARDVVTRIEGIPGVIEISFKPG